MPGVSLKITVLELAPKGEGPGDNLKINCRHFLLENTPNQCQFHRNKDSLQIGNPRQPTKSNLVNVLLRNLFTEIWVRGYIQDQE